MQDCEKTLSSNLKGTCNRQEDLPLSLPEKEENEMKASEGTIRELRRMIEIEEEEAKMKAKWSTIQERVVMKGIQTIFKKHKIKMKRREKEEFGKLKCRIKNEENRKKRELQDNVRRQTIEQLEILKSVGYRVVRTDDEYRLIPMCGACHKTNSQLSVCEECMVTWYCDEWCQRKHWEESHCNQCRTLRMKKTSCMFPFKLCRN